MHGGTLANSEQRTLRSSEALLRSACFGVSSTRRDKVGELMAGDVPRRHGSLAACKDCTWDRAGMPIV